MSRGAPRLALLLLLPAGGARAHHGVASGGFAAAEGPGAAIETTSALPLPERGLLLLAKEEYARFRHLDRAEPENKDHLSFTTLGVRIRSWLSAYLFAPFAVKAQDGIGTSAGMADPSVLVARAGLGRLGVALGVRRAIATALHEGSEQQGSEGLEAFRATAVATWATGL